MRLQPQSVNLSCEWDRSNTNVSENGFGETPEELGQPVAADGKEKGSLNHILWTNVKGRNYCIEYQKVGAVTHRLPEMRPSNTDVQCFTGKSWTECVCAIILLMHSYRKHSNPACFSNKS